MSLGGGGATGGADVSVGREQTTRRHSWMKREMNAAVESSLPSLAASHAWYTRSSHEMIEVWFEGYTLGQICDAGGARRELSGHPGAKRPGSTHLG